VPASVVVMTYPGFLVRTDANQRRIAAVLGVLASVVVSLPIPAKPGHLPSAGITWVAMTPPVLRS
jgi:hypothetical protein